MKKIIICSMTLLLSAAWMSSSAQVRVNVNVNIGSQPRWGPAGYDYVEYYYLPDIETYYYVPTRQFIYLSGGNWVFAYGLPPAYRSYDLYRGYKVVINQHNAYHFHHNHKVKYAGYKGHRGQVILRDKGHKYKMQKVKPRGKGKGHRHH